jgi:hypothetical protein
MSLHFKKVFLSLAIGIMQVCSTPLPILLRRNGESNIHKCGFTSYSLFYSESNKSAKEDTYKKTRAFDVQTEVKI